MKSLPFTRTVLLGMLPPLLLSCAINNEDRRRILNAMDRNLTPTSTTGKVLLAPLALPAGVVAGALDAVVVHPATQFDDAWYDTEDLLWDMDGETPFRQAVFTPLAVIATPVVYSLSWVVRSIFNVPDRDSESEDEGAAGAELLMEAAIHRGGVLVERAPGVVNTMGNAAESHQ